MASQAPQIPRQREQNQAPSSPPMEPSAQIVPQESITDISNAQNPQDQKESTSHNEEWEAIAEPGALVRSRSREHTDTPQVQREPARTCWICQMDDTEDTEENNEWRRPCPCSLTAHDACLMEWISNEEAPKPGEIAHNHHIKCPQCKAEIHIERPRHLFVSLVELVQTVVKLSIAPATVGALLSCTYWGLMAYGVHTLSVVFGAREGARMLKGPIFGVFNNGPFTMARLLSSISLFLGVPMIAPTLILLRTKLADQAFSLLLPLYFLYPSHRTISWPPSPALAFATVPYLRSAYNELYRLQFSGLEKEWDLAVQRRPRPGETAEQIAEEANRAEEDDEGEEVLEININFGGFGVEDPQQVEVAQVEIPPAGQQGDLNIPPGEIQPNPALANPNDPAQPRPNGDRRWEMQQNTSLSAITSTVMGALFFPVISSIAGDILHHILPSKFIQPSVIVSGQFFGRSKVTLQKGLLAERWGRTLVGGCLFVVLKDVVTLYCKWRKAKDFGNRKVKDWVGKRGRDVRPANQAETHGTV